MKIALWIARRNRPFSIVEDPELLDIFADLNINCVTPKRRTVSRDMKEIFHISQGNLASMLQVCTFLKFFIRLRANVRPPLHTIEVSWEAAYLR